MVVFVIFDNAESADFRQYEHHKGVDGGGKDDEGLFQRSVDKEDDLETDDKGIEGILQHCCPIIRCLARHILIRPFGNEVHDQDTEHQPEDQPDRVDRRDIHLSVQQYRQSNAEQKNKRYVIVSDSLSAVYTSKTRIGILFLLPIKTQFMNRARDTLMNAFYGFEIIG